MYLGKGKVLKKLHSPTQVANPETGLLRRGPRCRHHRTSGPPATGSSSCSTSCRRPPTPARIDRAEELLRLVSELYGAGLARVVELAREQAPS